MSTTPWGFFHTACLFAIIVTVVDVSGIGEPRAKKPLPQITSADTGIDKVRGLLDNLEYLK